MGVYIQWGREGREGGVGTLGHHVGGAGWRVNGFFYLVASPPALLATESTSAAAGVVPMYNRLLIVSGDTGGSGWMGAASFRFLESLPI